MTKTPLSSLLYLEVAIKKNFSFMAKLFKERNSLTLQHPIKYQSSLHTFDIPTLNQPLFSSIAHVSLFMMAFPSIPDQLPLVFTHSLKSISIIQFGLPFLSFQQSLKDNHSQLLLPTVTQLHSPPSLSHTEIQRMLPSSDCDGIC